MQQLQHAAAGPKEPVINLRRGKDGRVFTFMRHYRGLESARVREALSRVAVLVVLMHDRVALASCDQPTVDRHRDHEGDRKGHSKAPPEQRVG